MSVMAWPLSLGVRAEDKNNPAQTLACASLRREARRVDLCCGKSSAVQTFRPTFRQQQHGVGGAALGREGVVHPAKARRPERALEHLKRLTGAGALLRFAPVDLPEKNKRNKSGQRRSCGLMILCQST